MVCNGESLFSALGPGFSAFLIVLPAVLFLLFLNKNLQNFVGTMLVELGAAANLIEFIRFGCVKDPFSFFALFKFNIYDLFVTVGALILVYSVFSAKERR